MLLSSTHLKLKWYQIQSEVYSRDLALDCNLQVHDFLTNFLGKCLDLCHCVVTIKAHVTFATVDCDIREA